MSSTFAFTGGVRAQAQLNETLLEIGTSLVIRPQILIGEVHTKVQDGSLTDKASLDFAMAAVAYPSCVPSKHLGSLHPLELQSLPGDHETARQTACE